MNTQTVKPELISGRFKTNFIKWAKARDPFNFNKHTKDLTCFGKSFFDLPSAFQLPAFMEFGDSEEFCIHIEPYLGGGQPAYFASINYRNEVHIDMQYDVDNSNTSEFWTRHEATEMAVRCMSELYNRHVELIEAGYCQLKPIEQNTSSNSIENSIELGELKGGDV